MNNENDAINRFKALSLAKVARFVGDNDAADRLAKGDFSQEDIDNWENKQDKLLDDPVSAILGIMENTHNKLKEEDENNYKG